MIVIFLIIVSVIVLLRTVYFSFQNRSLLEITSFLILLDEYNRSYLTINVRCQLQNMGNGCKNTK